MKKIIFLAFFLTAGVSYAQDLKWDPKTTFDGVFDIVDSDFVPKPSKQPYEKVIENFKIEPQYCIFFEDIARNLKPAHELGMKTVWIENDEPWASKYSDSEFINYKTKNLANFLKEINEFRQI